jgi:ribosomal protein S27AE
MNAARVEESKIHCPLHVAVPMTLVKSRAPIWLVMPEGATGLEDEDGGIHKKRFERKFWKCPVGGCFRVEAYQLENHELKELRRDCPSCGAPTDAGVNARMVSQFTCKKCLRERSARNRVDRARRSQRWQAA